MLDVITAIRTQFLVPDPVLAGLFLGAGNSLVDVRLPGGIDPQTWPNIVLEGQTGVGGLQGEPGEMYTQGALRLCVTTKRSDVCPDPATQAWLIANRAVNVIVGKPSEGLAGIQGLITPHWGVAHCQAINPRGVEKTPNPELQKQVATFRLLLIKR